MSECIIFIGKLLNGNGLTNAACRWPASYPPTRKVHVFLCCCSLHFVEKNGQKHFKKQPPVMSQKAPRPLPG